MADVLIDGLVNTGLQTRGLLLGPVWTSTLVGYAFSGHASDMYYSKTTDGGATWAAAVQLVASGAFRGGSVWFDKWTPGDVGTKIHVAWFESTGSDVHYINLDTASDTISSATTVFNGASASGASAGFTNTACFIAKSKGGNIYVGYDIDNGTEVGFNKSTDGGANWSAALASPFEGVTDDTYILFPGNVADPQDMWLIYWDNSANEISIKVYDDSLDSWAETSIATSMSQGTTVDLVMAMNGAVRKSDGHIILAAWNGHSAPTADLRVWDVNGSASIVEKTVVITDTDQAAGIAVFINQVSNDIYLTYIRGTTYPGTTKVFYRVSTDGGATWSGETAYSEAAEESHGAVWSDMGTNNGRFEPMWWKATSNTLVNKVNSIAIASGGAGTGGKGKGGGKGGGTGTPKPPGKFKSFGVGHWRWGEGRRWG